MLSSLFPTVLSACLEILDDGKVTRFVTQNSKREFYRVKDSRKNDQNNPVPYYDVVEDFCMCFFFAK